MIEVRGLCAGYEEKNVLQDVNLKVPKGKVTVIAGPNGCGKSTLLKTLYGILPAKGGEIFIHGKELKEYPGRLLAQQVAYLSQNRQVPDITAERLVLHGRFPYLSYPRRYGRQDYRIAREAMERMGIADLAERPLQTLSGGMRQKVYIAMALAQDTPVVLFDEPTTFLDVSHQLQMMDNARFLCEEGKTVVMVLHDLPLALSVADQMIVMDQGCVVKRGTPEEIQMSGCLEEVFSVKIGTAETENGKHYYIESGKHYYIENGKRYSIKKEAEADGLFSDVHGFRGRAGHFGGRRQGSAGKTEGSGAVRRSDSSVSGRGF